MSITGGIIAYEDGIKTVAGDQFSPTRKVRVELNFTVDEGDDADVTILSVLNKAQSFVQGKLGIENPTPAAKRTTTKKAELPPGASEPAPGPTIAQTHEATVAAIAASSKVAGKHVSDKDKLAAAAGLTAEKPKPAADPAAIEDESTGEESLDDIMGGGAEATPVTDKDLTDAVQAKNKEIKDPVKIRGLVFEHNGGPGHEIKDIPQASRAAFLVKLKALTK